MDWLDLAQDRNRWRALVNAVMNLGVSQNAVRFLTRWGAVRFSGRTVLRGLVINVVCCADRHSCVVRIWKGHVGYWTAHWNMILLVRQHNSASCSHVNNKRKPSWHEREKRCAPWGVRSVACMWKKKIEMIVVSLPVLMTRDSACFFLCTLVQSVKLMLQRLS
jgi:hypothetical protein